MSRSARIALGLVRVYKLVFSPFFTGSCRYVPGCADYMTESITRHGLVQGGWLGTKRLCRCHPFGGHGYDPVPLSIGSPDRSPDRSPNHPITRSFDRSLDTRVQ